MMGLEMMLQGFGVDTEEVKRNVDGAMKLVQLICDRLDSVDKRLAEMTEHIAEINSLLVDLDVKSITAMDARITAQSGVLAMLQSKLTDIDAQLMLQNEWQRKDEWPPQITQTWEERVPDNERFAMSQNMFTNSELPTKDDK